MFFSKKKQENLHIETLSEFKERISYVYAPFSSDSIEINPNCWKKVNERGEFKPFYGDTIVYLLNDQVKSRCRYLQKELYKYCEDLFAEPLIEDTFHLTLHDLNNDSNIGYVYNQIEDTQVQVQKLMNSLMQDKTIVHLKSTRIINMVNTSLVLCFEPETEEDYLKLMTYYNMFQSVVSLPYPLTPHITLAYFNAAFDSLDEHMNFKTSFISSKYTNRLKSIVEQLNELDPIHLELSVFDLAYQHFASMNNYRTEYQLKESVLLVDDAAFMRLLMKDSLKDVPVVIHEADSVGQMIARIEEFNPTIIVLDSTLPGFDLDDSLEIIREMHSGAAVICLSSMPVCQDRIHQLGASSCLAKPLSSELFRHEILKYLHHKMEDVQ